MWTQPISRYPNLTIYWQNWKWYHTSNTETERAWCQQKLRTGLQEVTFSWTWTLDIRARKSPELEFDIVVTMFVRHTGPTVAPKMWDNSAEQNGLKSTVLLSDNVLIVFKKKKYSLFLTWPPQVAQFQISEAAITKDQTVSLKGQDAAIRLNNYQVRWTLDTVHAKNNTVKLKGLDATAKINTSMLKSRSPMLTRA